MKFYNHFVLSLVLALFTFSGLAQSCHLSLKGCVSDQDNHEHLGFVIVKLLNQGTIIQTNENGDFAFDSLCAGEYRLLFKHLGCRDTVVVVKLDKSKKLIVLLPHSINNLEELNIMDKRIEMKRTQSTVSVSPEEIQRSTGLSLGDVLRQVTGVTSLNTGPTIVKPMLHGLQGYRVLLLNNGVRQEGQQWGSEHAPEIDPFMAKKITVVKGASAIRYGSDAVAGVILVDPDELPDTTGINGELNLAGFSNGRAGAGSMMVQGRLEKLKSVAWRLQGSLKQSGNHRTPGYYLNNTGSAEQNWSYAMDYHHKKWGAELYYSLFNTQIGIYSGSHMGNLSDLQSALQRSKPLDSASGFSYGINRPNQQVLHELIKNAGHYHFTSQWRFKWIVARQYNARQEYDLRRLTTAERTSGVVLPDLDLKITSHSAEGIIEHDNIRSLRGMIGAAYLQQSNVYSGRFFIPNFRNQSIGIFAMERYVWRHAEWEAGIRYDQKTIQSYYYQNTVWTKSARSFSNWTYNTGFIWKQDTGFNLVLHAGSAWRAPAPNELYSNGIHQGVASIEKGDKNLNTETCYNVSATTLYHRRKLLVEVTAYVNQFKNFIFLNPSQQFELTIRGAFPVFNYQQADTRIHGLDLKTEWQMLNRFRLGLKGMMVRGWNSSASTYLINMPSDRAEIYMHLTLPHQKRLTRSYVQVNAQFVNKQWRVTANVDFAPSPKAYTLLNAELGAYFKAGQQTLFVQLSASNLLNTVYREYLDRFRYYCDAQGVSYNFRISIPLTFYKTKKPTT